MQNLIHGLAIRDVPADGVEGVVVVGWKERVIVESIKQVDGSVQLKTRHQCRTVAAVHLTHPRRHRHHYHQQQHHYCCYYSVI